MLNTEKLYDKLGIHQKIKAGDEMADALKCHLDEQMDELKRRYNNL